MLHGMPPTSSQVVATETPWPTRFANISYLDRNSAPVPIPKVVSDHIGELKHGFISLQYQTLCFQPKFGLKRREGHGEPRIFSSEAGR